MGYDALLDDPAVEAVYIPLSNNLHREWSIRAMKKGKHVLCEKPLGVTPEEMQDMMDVAKESGVYLMEAFAYLHSPFIAAVKDISSPRNSSMRGGSCLTAFVLMEKRK